MTSGFEKSGTVLTVHLPAELDHPASDEIRRDSDRIIGHNYIKNMIFDFSETVFMDSSGIGLLMGRYRALGMRGEMCAGYQCEQSYCKASAAIRSGKIY